MDGWLWARGSRRFDAEVGYIVGNEIKSSLRVLRYIDAKIQCSLQEMPVDVFFRLVESQDHHAIGVVVIEFVRSPRGILHVSKRPLLGGGHYGRC